MEEDELDPAFADLDSPSLLDHGFEGGQGFGSLSDDLEAGFGNALADELDDPILYEYDRPATPTRGSSLADALGHAFAEQDESAELELATPRKRPAAGTAAPSPNSNRLSLAFELASAASPGRTSSRDLLRELGIEEDEDGTDEQRSDSDDEEGDTLLQADSGRDSRPSSQLGSAFPGTETPSSSKTSPRRLGSSTSTTLPSSAASSDGHEDELAREEEIDASAQESTAALGSSMQTMDLFLSRLRQHTTSEVDPHSHHTLTPRSESAAEIDFTDRQPIVEALASSVIKSMYDFAKQREGQVRELVEMERAFARSDSAWQAALAELEELPRDDDADEAKQEEETAPPGPPEQEPTSPTPTDPALPAPIPSGDYSSQAPSHNTHPAPNQPPLLPTSSALAELSSLRAITTSLVSALATINEVTQVNQAATGDAGRKLRALRGHLTTVKDDQQAVASSEEFIADFEVKEERRARLSGRSRAQEAKEEMESAGRQLAESWIRAQTMLAVSA